MATEESIRYSVYIRPENLGVWKNFSDHQTAIRKTPSQAIIQFVKDEVLRYQGKDPKEFSAERIESLEGEYRKLVKEKAELNNTLTHALMPAGSSSRIVYDACVDVACKLAGVRCFDDLEVTDSLLLQLYTFKQAEKYDIDSVNWNNFLFVVERALKLKKLNAFLEDARSKAVLSVQNGKQQTVNLIMDTDLETSEEDPQPETTNEQTTETNTEAVQDETKSLSAQTETPETSSPEEEQDRDN